MLKFLEFSRSLALSVLFLFPFNHVRSAVKHQLPQLTS